MTQAASRRTRCTQCLCCDAVIVFEGEALCAACDEGTHPLLPESQAKASEPKTESRKVSMKRLTPDEIAAIQAAPASESTSALARRLGLNLPAVSYQRLVFQRKQGKAVHAQHAAQPRAEIPASQPTEPEGADWIPEPEPVPPPAPQTARVVFSLRQEQLDAWWGSLTIEGKASLFAANLSAEIGGRF
jgi:hypothetical protein